jgi:hypothetical protein
MVNCSNRNCNYNFPPDYFIVYSKWKKRCQKEVNEVKEVNNYEEYEKILDGLIKIELFCITCCINQTIIICNNSNIPIKKYLGYIHKLEEK